MERSELMESMNHKPHDWDNEEPENFYEELEQNYNQLLDVSGQIIELYNKILTSLINDEDSEERKDLLTELRKLIHDKIP